MAVSRKNLNQFRKVYPGIRKTPRYETTVTLDENVTIETGVAHFSGSYTTSYTFTNTYSDAPVVTGAISGTDSDSNVNIFINALSTTAVTFEGSQASSGSVNLIVIGKTS